MLKVVSVIILLFSLHAAQGELNESEKPQQMDVYLVQNPPFSAFDNGRNAQGLLVQYWQNWSHLTGISVNYYPYLKQDLTLLSTAAKPAVYSGLAVDKEQLIKLRKKPILLINCRFYYNSKQHKTFFALLAGKNSSLRVGGLLPQGQQLPLFSATSNLSYQEYPGLLELLFAFYKQQIDALVLFEGEAKKIDLLNRLLSLFFSEKLVVNPSNALFAYVPETQQTALEWISWGNALDSMPDKVALTIAHGGNPIWGVSEQMHSKLLMIAGFLFLLLLVNHSRRKKERQFKDLLDSSPFPVIIFSLDGRVIYYFNDELKSLFILKKIKHQYIFAEPENQLLLSRFINKASHKVVIEAEQLRLLLDDRFHDMEISAKRVYYKRKSAWLCYLKDINALLQAEQKLTEERALLRKVLDSIPEQIVFKSSKGTVIGCNRSWAKANQTTVGKATGRRLSELISLDLADKQKQQEVDVWQGVNFKEQAWLQQENCRSCLINCVKLPLYNDKGAIFAILSIESDITDLYNLHKQIEDQNLQRKQTEIALSKQNLLLSTVFAASIDPIALLDKEGHVIGANNAFAALMGTNPVDITGQSQSMFLSAEQGEWVERKNREVIASDKPLIFEEQLNLNGKEIWYEVSKTPFNDEKNNYQGIVIMARDITLHKQTEEKLSSEASDFELQMLHDPLTGIANRRSFDLQFERFWKEAIEQQELLSIVMCDVDFFKDYNDNYGHQKGDKVLQEVAQALERTCEEFDCFVARYGGEEFVVLIKGGNATNALKVAENLREAIIDSKIEHHYSSASSILTMSMGLASIQPSALYAMPMLLAEADSAMYDAKNSGRNQICVQH